MPTHFLKTNTLNNDHKSLIGLIYLLNCNTVAHISSVIYNTNSITGTCTYRLNGRMYEGMSLPDYDHWSIEHDPHLLHK